MTDINELIKPVCKECGGKCCRNPAVSSTEIERLRRLGHADFFFNNGGLKYIKGSPRCFFFSENGCRLPVGSRPVECRFFPLYFVHRKNRIETRTHSAYRCPFVRSIIKKEAWYENASALIQRVSEEWSPNEVAAYSDRHSLRRMALDTALLGLIRHANGLFNLFIRGTYDQFTNPFSR